MTQDKRKWNITELNIKQNNKNIDLHNNKNIGVYLPLLVDAANYQILFGMILQWLFTEMQPATPINKVNWSVQIHQATLKCGLHQKPTPYQTGNRREITLKYGPNFIYKK